LGAGVLVPGLGAADASCASAEDAPVQATTNPAHADAKMPVFTVGPAYPTCLQPTVNPVKDQSSLMELGPARESAQSAIALACCASLPEEVGEFTCD
jgi:hypothetical protein